MDGNAPLAPVTSPGRATLNELLRLAWPVVGARLGIMTMGLSDSIVVGRYSARELGYHALGWAPTSIIVTMVIGLLAGAQVMAARATGEGRPYEAGAVLRRALSYGAVIGVASTVFLAIVGPFVMSHFGLEPDLARGAIRVMQVFNLSMLPYAISCAAAFWLEGLGRPTPGMWIMWAANVLNLIVDLVLVPGHRVGGWQIAPMGALGGAWATFSARTFLSVVLLGYIARMPDARRLGVFDKPVRDKAAEATQRGVGYGAGASNAFEVTAFASLNLFAGWIGGWAVAAWAVTINVAAIIFMVPLGLGTAAAVLVGRAYGARDAAQLRRAAGVSFGVTSVFGLVISLITLPLAGFIAHAYTADWKTAATAGGLIALGCLFYWPDALQVVAAQALRARGDVLVPSITHLTSYVVFMMPLAWALAIPCHLGVTGLMWGVIAASFLAAAFLLGRFWMLDRRGI